MKRIISLFLLFYSVMVAAQDITGTWEGELVNNGGAFDGLQRVAKMKWELVQIKKEVFGVVYFYPQDTRPSDKPTVWYSWYGKLGKKADFPFQFIQGKFIEGLGTTTVFQFIVRFEHKDVSDKLTGPYFNQLEALHSRERSAGFYKLERSSADVSDQLAMKMREKRNIEKLEKQK